MHLTPVVTFRPTKIKVWTIVSPFTLGFFIRFLGSVFVFWGTLTMHSTLLLAFTSTKTNEGAFCKLHQRAECTTRLIFSCVSSSVGSLLVCSSTSKGKQQTFHSAPTLILSVFHTHSLSLLSPPLPPPPFALMQAVIQGVHVVHVNSNSCTESWFCEDRAGHVPSHARFQ